MSADKKPLSHFITMTGLVVEKYFGRGTRSAHEALCLRTSTEEYVLRRLQGNPFQDESLEQFKGKFVKATGLIDRHTFLAKDIEESKEGSGDEKKGKKD